MTDKHVLEERRRAHSLARRLIAFLKDGHEWSVRFVSLNKESVRRRLGFEKPIVGAYIPDKQLICIDHGYEDFFSVLIHECLHAVYPDMEEAGILNLERIVRKHLTARQAKHLLVWAANRIE